MVDLETFSGSVYPETGNSTASLVRHIDSVFPETYTAKVTLLPPSSVVPETHTSKSKESQSAGSVVPGSVAARASFTHLDELAAPEATYNDNEREEGDNPDANNVMAMEVIRPTSAVQPSVVHQDLASKIDDVDDKYGDRDPKY